jgi:hypothetical protein
MNKTKKTMKKSLKGTLSIKKTLTRSIKKKGGCDCMNKGGKMKKGKALKKTRHRKMKGGYVDSPTFPPNAIPQEYYYKYNDLAGSSTDPTSPNMQPSSHLLPDIVPPSQVFAH